ERRARAGQHRARRIAGGQHQRRNERLVRQLNGEDQGERRGERKNFSGQLVVHPSPENDVIDDSGALPLIALANCSLRRMVIEYSAPTTILFGEPKNQFSRNRASLCWSAACAAHDEQISCLSWQVCRSTVRGRLYG